MRGGWVYGAVHGVENFLTLGASARIHAQTPSCALLGALARVAAAVRAKSAPFFLPFFAEFFCFSELLKNLPRTRGEENFTALSGAWLRIPVCERGGVENRARVCVHDLPQLCARTPRRKLFSLRRFLCRNGGVFSLM